MNVENTLLLSGVVSIAVYLIAALIFPERF